MITFCAFFVFALTLWTFATLVAKDDYQDAVKDELGKMFGIIKMFISSIKNLIKFLIKSSFSTTSDKQLESKKDNLVSITETQENQSDTKVA